MMSMSKISQLDGCVLLGILNSKLRLECDSLEEFQITYNEVDLNCITNKLCGMGYQYDELTNQFRAVKAA